MIVYIKGRSGKIYASPVFAEIGKGWNTKSVVLNEDNNGLILLPYLIKIKNEFTDFNYHYINKTLQSGWIKKIRTHGFAEIVNNKELIKELKRGNTVPIEGLQCVKSYNLPLSAITEFSIKTEQDITDFYTASWGLHDACIEKIDKTDSDIIIHFDTTWGKHIIITFHGVAVIKHIENISCILDSEFRFIDNCIMWKVTAMLAISDNDSDENPYIIAKAVTWELLID